MEMGHSQFAAEKALYFTINRADIIESAISWLEEHKNDGDLEKKFEKGTIQLIEYGMKVVQEKYKDNEDLVSKCFKAISVFVSNAIKAPSNPGYHGIDMSSNAYKEKVGSLVGARLILDGFGYIEVDGKLIIDPSIPFDKDFFEVGK